MRPHLSRLFSAWRASHGFTGGCFFTVVPLYSLVGSVSGRVFCMAGQALYIDTETHS